MVVDSFLKSLLSGIRKKINFSTIIRTFNETLNQILRMDLAKTNEK